MYHFSECTYYFMVLQLLYHCIDNPLYVVFSDEYMYFISLRKTYYFSKIYVF